MHLTPRLFPLGCLLACMQVSGPNCGGAAVALWDFQPLPAAEAETIPNALLAQNTFFRNSGDDLLKGGGLYAQNVPSLIISDSR